MKTQITLSLLTPIIALTAQAALIVQPAAWSSPTNTDLAGVSLTLSSSNQSGAEPIIFTEPMTNLFALVPSFSAAPLPPNAQFTHFATPPGTSTLMVKLSQPVEGLLLYALWWRGALTGQGDPATLYTFDQPFTILWGFDRVTRNGNTLILPDDTPLGPPEDLPGFHSGIIQFPGVIDSLSITVNNTTGGRGFQGLTFGIGRLEPDFDRLCPCAGPVTGGKWKNHGQYVSCMSRAAQSALEAGLITEAAKDAVVQEAAHSRCGRE